MKLLVNIELIHGRCAHLRSPLPGIGESAGEEGAQGFDPFTTRGFVRVARGRYPAGAVWPPVAYAAADPIDGPAEQGGIRSVAARTIKLNVISTTALASRTKPRIGIAGEEPGWPLQRAR